MSMSEEEENTAFLFSVFSIEQPQISPVAAVGTACSCSYQYLYTDIRDVSSKGPCVVIWRIMSQLG